MAQSSEQIQQQEQEQRQTLSQRELLFVRMLELPTEELEERVRAEVQENPALEVSERDADDQPPYRERQEEPEETGEGEPLGVYAPEDPYGDDGNGDSPLGDYLTPDDVPDYVLKEPRNESGARSPEDIPFAASTSFYDLLMAQLGECPLASQDRDMAEYLIGSLDDDGLLRKTLTALREELAIYRNIYTTTDEVLRVLKQIQQFDPAGVGAQNLQECLWLQLQRKPASPSIQTARLMLEKCYDDFTHKRWEHIRRKLSLTEEDFQKGIEELTRLNPRPGSSLGESIDKGMQRIIPDFIVTVDDDENVTFTLNDSNVPDLRISDSFNKMIKEHSQNEKTSRESQEALLFLRKKVEAAQAFIEVIKERQRTLTATMQAIIDLQKPFFIHGDEDLLKPMRLKDVADHAGMHLSTVSRVNNCKYVETGFGIYPLKFFFSERTYRRPPVAQKDKKKTRKKSAPKKEDETSQRQIRLAIQECVNNEDKQHPLNDEQLAALLKKKGFDMARRTIAKYREQLGIPTARMRRN